MDYLKVITEYALPTVGMLLSAVALALVPVLVKWVTRKAGISDVDLEAAIASQWSEVLRGAVAAAEHRGQVWARERREAAPGVEKLEHALVWAAREAAERKLPELARDRLIALIEAKLGDPDEPGGTARTVRVQSVPPPTEAPGL